MSPPAVTGLNHVTLAVADLRRSIAFYTEVLGLRLRAEWPEGAYLSAGVLWLCLALDPAARTARREDYTHLALDARLDEFDALSTRIRAMARIWKENRSEGASVYFLDPDGHRLELHVGSLETRLAHYRAHPAPDRILND